MRSGRASAHCSTKCWRCRRNSLESCLDDLEQLQQDEFLTGESPGSPFTTTLAGQRIGRRDRSRTK